MAGRAIAEDKDGAAEGLFTYNLATHRGKAIDAFAEVHRLRGKQNAAGG